MVDRHFGRPTKWVASFGRGVRLLRQSDLREPRNPQTVTRGDQICVGATCDCAKNVTAKTAVIWTRGAYFFTDSDFAQKLFQLKGSWSYLAARQAILCFATGDIYLNTELRALAIWCGEVKMRIGGPGGRPPQEGGSKGSSNPLTCFVIFLWLGAAAAQNREKVKLTISGKPWLNFFVFALKLIGLNPSVVGARFLLRQKHILRYFVSWGWHSLWYFWAYTVNGGFFNPFSTFLPSVAIVAEKLRESEKCLSHCRKWGLVVHSAKLYLISNYKRISKKLLQMHLFRKAA